MNIRLPETCLMILLLGVPTLYSRAQMTSLPVPPDSISCYLEQMAGRIPDSEKLALSREMEGLLTAILEEDSSFYISFRKVVNLGVLTAPDSIFRIFQWNVPLSDGTHIYHALIQESPREGPARLFHLKGSSGGLKRHVPELLDTANWYGCLYYDLIPSGNDSLNYYVLLGSDMNNLFSSIKVIDALWFDEQGIPVFGLPVFETEEQWQCRVVFEYAARVRMSLRYHPDRQMIIYDHLSPMDPAYEGKYQFYGPDFSYDGLLYREGRWFLQKDVDVRNK